MDADGPETWGSWYNRRFYSLEVVQEPIRARMCGFGDKDRRPLAPATVAKLIIKNEDQTLVNDDDIDCSFFVVTADLWSPDGKFDRNLVLHPTSSDRYKEASPQTGTPSNSRYPVRLPVEDQMTGLSHVPTEYDGSGYPYPHAQHDAGGNSITLQTAPNYNAIPDNQDLAYHTGTTAQATHTYPVRPLPSSLSTSMAVQMGIAIGVPGPQYDALDAQGQSSISSNSVPSAFDPSLSSALPAQYQSVQLQDGQPPWSQPVSPTSHARVFTHSGPRPPQEMPVSRPDTGPPPNHTSLEQPMYASASMAQQQMREGHLSPSSSSSPVANIPLPGHVYTRTLVGPLSANACRLLDEHRKPGVFFLFQDLSIRTEGRFRLRLRLMNVGALTSPENGALRVHNDVSPILAQTYTQGFDVYSAKRFPGVPDTTALSIAFGNQGQKLPLVRVPLRCDSFSG
ncbi:velvet factor-domain-containing protein [Russula earlei]|uniref:Velvet factor-domain-containing protein n=1 Tax=Russula earlei TaxID=71964 RepID=A0ACC0UR34_9AGAM|nr:velvet factor-domain-containing protein [Russula earlei]